MVRTRVGYAGGTLANPTYRSMGDHTESFQVDFDPETLPYERLLDLFWGEHNPCAGAGSRQYMSAVFFHDEEQRRAAEASKAAQEARLGRPVRTPILPVGTFTVAEDYHQKYALRQDRALLREFQAFYPEARRLMDSTAAARVNGYLAGHGTAEQLEAELPDLGLSPGAGERLTRLRRGR